MNCHTPFVGALLAIATAVPIAAQDRIVFVSDRDGNRELYSMAVDGRDVVNLTRHPNRDQSPAVSADQGRLAWFSDRSGVLGVWIAPGLDAHSVARAQLLAEAPDLDFGLAWSPDGRQLAVSLRDPDAGTHDIGLLDATSGELTRLTSTPDIEEITPVWNRTGTHLFYVTSGIGSGPSALWTIALESGESTILVPGLPDASFPQLSPDGSQLLLRSRTSDFDVLLVDLPSRSATPLVNDPSNDWGAAWALDGESVYFASDRDGDLEIFRLHIASGDVVQLTDNQDRDWMPTLAAPVR